MLFGNIHIHKIMLTGTIVIIIIYYITQIIKYTYIHIHIDI